MSLDPFEAMPAEIGGSVLLGRKATELRLGYANQTAVIPFWSGLTVWLVAASSVRTLDPGQSGTMSRA